MKNNFYSLSFLRPFFFLLSFACLSQLAVAQNQDGSDPLNSSATPTTVFPNEEMWSGAKNLKRFDPANQTPRPEAMWDIHFKFSMNDSIPLGHTPRVYGIVWTGTEFWGTPWSSASGNYMDSIYRYSQTGRFLGVYRMGNLAGLRAMTVLNGAVWGCNATDSIYKISIQTGAVLKKVKAGTTGGIRYITADNTGKFWVGNFSTAISQIDTNGVVSQSIPATTHGLNGIAGAVFDNFSTGGPYLWLNNQSSQTTNDPLGTYVRVMKVNPTAVLPVQRNVLNDAPDIGPNIAGSMTLTQLPGRTKPTLVVLTQGSNAAALGRVVGYELDFTPPAIAEVAIDSVRESNGYTLIPRPFAGNLTLSARANNRGTAVTPSDSKLYLDIYRGGSIVASRNVPLNLASFTNQVLNLSISNNLTTGDYDAFMLSSVTGDPLAANDSLRAFFSITDSSFGRDLMDRGQTFTGWGPGGGFPATPRRIGTTYTFPTRATINSVTMFYRSANVNDSLHVALFKVVNGRPTDSIGGSAIHVTTVDDVIGNRRTFRLLAPVTVNAGETVMFASTDDGRGSHFVYTTTNILPQNSCFVYRQAFTSATYGPIASGWYSDTALISAGAAVQRRGFVIRPNLSIRTDINEPTGNIKNLVAMPNPTTGDLHLSLTLETADKVRVEVLDLAGRTVHTEGVVAVQQMEKDLSLHHLSNGFYFVRITTDSGGRMIKKIVKQ